MVVVDRKMVERRRWKGDGGALRCRGVVGLLWVVVVDVVVAGEMMIVENEEGGYVTVWRFSLFCYRSYRYFEHCQFWDLCSCLG